MRKVIFIIGLIALSANAAYSQGAAEEKMVRKISELTKMGIDTIMVYGPTIGGVFSGQDTSPCYVYHNARYLIWMHQGHSFITYIDECYEHEILKDKIKPVASLLTEHLSKLIQENIKHPTFKIMQNGKEKITTMTTSDDMGLHFAFNVKGHIYNKDFSLSDLTTEYGLNHNHKNIYYDQNQKTYLKQAYDIIQKLLPVFKFTKQ